MTNAGPPRLDDFTTNKFTGRKPVMAHYMLVRHKVRDFSEWKRGYDDHLPKRVEVGLTEQHLLQSTDDPNEVVALFAVRDLNSAKAFAESAELKQAM